MEIKLCIIDKKAEAQKANCQEEHLANFGMNAAATGVLMEKVEESMGVAKEDCAAQEDNEKESFGLTSAAMIDGLQSDKDGSSGKGNRLSE